ncbi:hypothetical protein Zmor_007844 [Zophobas morio]|uniref:CCHC-type domain-containing protein n=1 Tax=Zophobas morio TaxID=2755281 RepID=A0AA38J148_9CUCU|nr:hypothetical protein Zmor_007844 [Zophobas morio]
MNDELEVLGRDNYDTWKIQMKALLIKNDAWGYVSGSNVKPEDNAAEVQEWTNRDEKAKSDLILSIGASQLKMVKNCATSRELWQKLEDTFQSRGPARKASLLKNLTLKKMNEGDDIHEHLHEFFDSVDKLAEMDVNINDDLLAIMLLYSLPASFENFRVAIESRDVLPTPDNLRTKITEEYGARKNTTTSNSNQGAMYVQKNKQKNKREKNVVLKEEKKDKFFNFKCFRCHQQGHRQAQCPLRKVNNSSASVALFSTEVKFDVCHNVSRVTRNDWCLDSGCTSHLCRDLGPNSVKYKGTLVRGLSFI